MFMRWVMMPHELIDHCIADVDDVIMMMMRHTCNTSFTIHVYAYPPSPLFITFVNRYSTMCIFPLLFHSLFFISVPTRRKISGEWINHKEAWGVRTASRRECPDFSFPISNRDFSLFYTGSDEFLLKKKLPKKEFEGRKKGKIFPHLD
jgi:hypothetical protein